MMMMIKSLLTLALVVASATAFTAPSSTPFVVTARHYSGTMSSSSLLSASILDTIATLEGPGQVWGAEGIEVGKEESDLKGYDNFGLFAQRLQSTGVAQALSGPGPFTVFAPTDTAIQSYEAMKGPVDANVLNYCIVPGNIASSALSSAPLTTLQGSALTYGRRFRKDFVDDAIVGEKTFGRFSDFPTDVACDNGVIHAVGIMLAPN